MKNGGRHHTLWMVSPMSIHHKGMKTFDKNENVWSKNSQETQPLKLTKSKNIILFKHAKCKIVKGY